MFFQTAIDEVLRVAFKANVRNPETDVVITTTIRDDSDDLLLGWSTFTRPDAFEAEMFPGLTISVGSPYCTAQYGERSAPLTFTTSFGSCTVNDTSDAACTLWGKPYSIRVFDSYERNQNPSPVVTFSIAKPDRLVPGQLP